MNTRIVIALVFLGGCALGGASSRFTVPLASAQQAATLTKWEYSCEALDNDEATQVANKMGAQGWEMVGAGDYPRENHDLWCFKRPKL